MMAWLGPRWWLSLMAVGAVSAAVLILLSDPAGAA